MYHLIFLEVLINIIKGCHGLVKRLAKTKERKAR